MARSIAAPGSARRLGRRALGVRVAPASRGRPPTLGLRGPTSLLPRRLADAGLAAADILTKALAAVRRHRRLRIALLSALVVLPLLGGAWLWLRHSSLVAVEQVRIEGLASGAGRERGAIETALTGAARKMSTLDVKPATLEAAVAQYPVVRAVHARARVPHGLDIEVVEQPPVAALGVGAARTAVAADGVVLGSVYLTPSLPLVHAATAASSAATASAAKVTTPTVAATTGTGASANASARAKAQANGRVEAIPAIGHSLRGGIVMAELKVLGAAPGPLAREVTNAYYGSHGLTLAFQGRLLAYFGDASRARAKWAALVRVLVDPGSAGAAYVDVRLPERPAAGFPPGTVAPDGGSLEAGQSSGTDPATAAELAAGLNAAVAGGSSTGSAAGAATAPTASEPSAGGEAGASSEASGEAGAGSEGG